MTYEEFLQRFKRLEAHKEMEKNRSLYLSTDRTIGIPKKFKEECFLSLGKFKLKERLSGLESILVTKDLTFQLRLLYRAMNVLRRRRKFEFGLYLLERGRVFALREEDKIVLFAPYISDKPHPKPFEELVSGNTGQLKRWRIWSKII